MLALIEPLEAEGTLVKRSRELLEAEIGNFLVVEHDGVIVGCAALYPFPEEKSAEFACLAVADGYRDAGYGERLLKACEERAKGLSCGACSRSPRTPRTGSSSRASAPATWPRCPRSARRSTTGGAARRCSSSAYNFADGSNGEVREARPRGRGPGIPALPRRARQAHLGERLQGSLGAVAQAADHAGEREPAQPRRPQGAQVPDGADRAAFLRRGAPTSPRATSRRTQRQKVQERCS